MDTEKRIDTRKDRTAERAQAGDLLKYAGLKSFQIKDVEYIKLIAPTIINKLSEIEINNTINNKYNPPTNIIETANKIIITYKTNKKETISTRELISAGSILISAGLDMKKYAPKREGVDNIMHKIAVYAVYISASQNF